MDLFDLLKIYAAISAAVFLFFLLGGPRGWLGDDKNTDNVGDFERGACILVVSIGWLPFLAVGIYFGAKPFAIKVKKFGIKCVKKLGRATKPNCPKSTLRRLKETE